MLLITLAFAVDRMVPSQYATVAEALSAAQPGDTLVIGPATHDFDVPQITVTPLTIRGSGLGVTFLQTAGTTDASNTTLYLQDLTFDGLTIRQGFHAENAHIEVERVHFFRTRAATGAAIELIDGVGVPGQPEGLVVRDSEFTFGASTEYGAAIAVEGGDGVRVTGTTIANNISTTRGAVALFDVDATFVDTTFNQNSGPMGGAIAQVDGGSLHLHGGVLTANTSGPALYAEGEVDMTDLEVHSHYLFNHDGVVHIAPTGSLVATNVTFDTNQSDAGAISLHGPGAFANAHFQDGSALVGGAIQAHAELSITDSRFVGNQATQSAGAVSASGVVTLQGTLFESNYAPVGAAIQTATTSITTVTDCAFADNDNFNNGNGGAIHAQGPLDVFDTDFGRNRSLSGGAIFIDGADLTVTGSTFQDNDVNGDGGGAIAAAHAEVVVRDTWFEDNSAGWGGALFITADSPTPSVIEGNAFCANTAVHNGGAVHVTGSASLASSHDIFVGNTAGSGGALSGFDSAHVTLDHGHFVHNVAGFGALARVLNDGTVAVTDAAIAHSGTSVFSAAPPASIEVGTVGVYAAPNLGDGVPANIVSGDPMFLADPINPGCTVWDYAFAPGSSWLVGDSIGQSLGAFGDSEWIDADGDGRPAIDDCDDGDPAIHPGAIEVCDIIDNDCDGETDEGFPLTAFYEDGDNDGVGATYVGEFCVAPPGTSAEDGDCDDTDPNRYAGAAEVCDGVDNDCDFEVDEDFDIVSWYVDGDGDGYGDNGSLTSGCEDPPNAAPREGDCDDGDGAVNPDAEEICDGRDNDCNGGVDEGLPTTVWFEDADGDGLGAGEGVEACGPPEGWVDNAGDCDPESAANIACDPPSVTGCACRSADIPISGWWKRRR